MAGGMRSAAFSWMSRLSSSRRLLAVLIRWFASQPLDQLTAVTWSCSTASLTGYRAWPGRAEADAMVAGTTVRAAARATAATWWRHRLAGGRGPIGRGTTSASLSRTIPRCRSAASGSSSTPARAARSSAAVSTSGARSSSTSTRRPSSAASSLSSPSLRRRMLTPVLLPPQACGVRGRRLGFRGARVVGHPEHPGQAGQAAVLQRLDRVGGLVEDPGHLGRGEVGDQAQQQHLALVRGELPQGGQHPVTLDPLQRQLLWVHRPAGRRGLLEQVVQGLDAVAGLAAAVVGQVVAGDAEQPAPECLHRTTEAGQALDRAFEDVAGEVLGGVAVADRGEEEAEQGRGVGGVEAGDGGRLAAARTNQISRCQVESADALLLPPGPDHLPPASAPNVAMRLSDRLDSS